MSHARVPLLASLALAAAIAACAGTPSSAPRDDADDRRAPPAASGPSADDRLAAGDFEGAALRYARDAAAAPDDAALAEKLRTANRLAAQRRAERAAIAADKGDFATAAQELRRAEAFDADAEPVRRVRAALEPTIRVTEEVAAARGRAREQMSTDPAAAVEALTDLRRRAPYDAEIVELLTEATRRAEADRAAARAAEAWDAGVRRRAVELLAVASSGGRPSPRASELRRRMENDLVAESSGADLAGLRDLHGLAADAGLAPGVVSTIRDRLAEALRRETRRLGDAGRPASAALLEIETRAIGGRVDTDFADRVRAERAIRVHVLPFDDATGGSVDGLRLARAIRDRLAIDSAGGSAPFVATDAPPPADAAFPHLVLDGTALSLHVTSGRVGRETKRVEYVQGLRDVANPAVVRMNSDLAAVRTRLARARDEEAAADEVVRRLRGLDYGRGAGGTVPTEGDAALQMRIATAEATAATARRRAEAAQREEFDLRQHMLATPATNSEPVMAIAYVEVETRVRTGAMAAKVRLRDGGTVLLDESVPGSDVHRETVAAGVPEAGIAPDPDDSPDDAAMAARAADGLAQAVAGKVRDAAVRAARRLLQEARDAERRGDPASAAESYAVYLLSTPEIATPERADAARALREILGAAPALVTGYRAETSR